MTSLLNSIFVRKYSVTDYRSLGLDLHSHVLPGIDDGPSELVQSIALLKSIQDLGFERCVLTPHVSSDYYPNTTTDIFNAFDVLNTNKEGVHEQYIHSVAAEYLLDADFMQMITSRSLLTLPGNRVLFELPYSGAPLNCEEAVFAMTARGYIPVLAHPERYSFWFKDGRLLTKLISLGCEIQVNILSLIGYYGSQVKKSAYKIMDDLEVDLLATDCHNQKHVAALRAGLKDRYLAAILSKKRFKNATLLESIR